MMSTDDHYKLLGLEYDATADDIKQKYRSLQLKLHPDKNNSSENTKQYEKITTAYNILSNPYDREKYDERLRNANMNKYTTHTNANTDVLQPRKEQDNINMPINRHNEGGGTVDEMMQTIIGKFFSKPAEEKTCTKDKLMNSLMSSILNNGEGFSNIGQNVCMGAENMGFLGLGVYVEPIVKTIEISILNAYNGSYVPILIKREITNVIRDKINVIYEEETLYINIPKGMDNNEVITIKGKGNIYGKERGDVRVTIKMCNDAKFSRNGMDLIYKKSISLKEALCGFTFKIEHLNSKIYNVDNFGKIIQPGSEQRIKNLGFAREDSDKVGDMLIHFDVVFPTNLSEETFQKIKELAI